LTKSRQQPEREIQLAILKYMKARGWTCGKIKTTGARRGKAFLFDPYQFRGIADLLAFTPYGLCFIEVKAGKNQLSPDQIRFEELCKLSGTCYIVARSLDDIIKIFP